jgi:hypothetical protein
MKLVLMMERTMTFFWLAQVKNIELLIFTVNQPPQSPDFNKLDSCLFNSLDQRVQIFQGNGFTIPELMKAFKAEWDAYPPADLIRVHALLHVVTRCVLENKGGNQRSLPPTPISINARQKFSIL